MLSTLGNGLSRRIVLRLFVLFGVVLLLLVGGLVPIREPGRRGQRWTSVGVHAGSVCAVPVRRRTSEHHRSTVAVGDGLVGPPLGAATPAAAATPIPAAIYGPPPDCLCGRVWTMAAVAGRTATRRPGRTHSAAPGRAVEGLCSPANLCSAPWATARLSYWLDLSVSSCLRPAHRPTRPMVVH